ncbi:LysR substrate-binding domain-containing protein [Pseudanabaena sp. BC1403]|uniref:LysR substrate-binding domain-containing protein n=1 Tax=Pseudanabaena sp. BC1403 TaxID=2043171 RepID=UPI000CD98094|nr:LysR substrate-binding domain-containing protein [Pseudanabaena sp. BC1403]
MENLNDIMIFTKIVEQGSLTAAAERLALPKSSVSRALSRLEERLSTRLLQRSTRRIHLTEIGRRYYDHCCRIVQELEVANSMVGNYQSQPSGLLRITAPYILGQAFLGAIVIEFLNSYPNVQCKVELSNRHIDLIEEGFDLGIRVGKLPDSSLMMQHLGQATAALFASPIYLEKYGNPQIPADLQNHILLDNTKTLKKSWKLCQGSLQTEIPVLPRLVCNDMAILLEAAIAHQGIAVLPMFATIDAVKNLQLKRVLQDWYIKKVEINALYPSYKDLSPVVSAFIDLARQSLKKVLIDA